MTTLIEYLSEEHPIARWRILGVGLAGAIAGACASYLFSMLAMLS